MELTLKESVKLARKIVRGAEKFGIKTILCPSFTSLEEVGKITKGKKTRLGSQDMFWKEEGPFTGEVSARELKKIGVKYVILGHSERRKLGETDKIVRKKLEAALQANLNPILCIGETLDERKGKKMGKVLRRQVSFAFKNLKIDNKKIIIAYEPIWAIGTGRPAHPEDAKEASKIIKKELEKYFSEKTIKKQVSVIYGGSVNSEIVSDFITDGEMLGALVGGSSLNGEEFLKIIKNISRLC